MIKRGASIKPLFFSPIISPPFSPFFFPPLPQLGLVSVLVEHSVPLIEYMFLIVDCQGKGVPLEDAQGGATEALSFFVFVGGDGNVRRKKQEKTKKKLLLRFIVVVVLLLLLNKRRTQHTQPSTPLSSVQNAGEVIASTTTGQAIPPSSPGAVTFLTLVELQFPISPLLIGQPVCLINPQVREGKVVVVAANWIGLDWIGLD